MRTSGSAARALGAVLVCMVMVGASTAARAQSPREERLSVELGLDGAVTLAHGTDTMVGGSGQFTFRLLWPFGPRVRLGLRAGLLVTRLPAAIGADMIWRDWDQYDPDAPYDTKRYYPFISAAFLFQVKIWRWLEADATVGVNATITGRSPIMPQLGLGVLFYVYRQPLVHVAVRFGCDAYALLNHPSQAWLFVPTLGVIVRFPVRKKPPPIHKDDIPDPFEERFKKRRW